MLIKERLLFVKDNEHEFEEILKTIGDKYEIEECGYDYSTIQLKAMDMEADHIICSLSGIEKNDFLKVVPSLPKLVVLYKEYNNEINNYFDEYNIASFHCGNTEKKYIEDLFKKLCSDVPYRYKEFRVKIQKIIYQNFVRAYCRYFEGFALMAIGVEYIFFCDNRSVMSSGEIYRCISEKAGISAAAVEVAIRRCICHMWSNKHLFSDCEMLKDILRDETPPSNTKMMYASADKLFFMYRSDFYRYYEALEEAENSNNDQHADI